MKIVCFIRCISSVILFAVPSAAPEDIQAGMVNVTSAFIKWNSPPPQHINGVLLGYKVSN